MNLKVKQKIVNGKMVMGIINEDLKEYVPFKFKNIKNFSKQDWCHYSYNYFMCEKDNGACSLYDENGNCFIDCKDGYKNLKLLKRGAGSNSIYVIAEKDGEFGILEASLPSSGKKRKAEVKAVYDFGKCDEIKELEDGTVKLIKHTKRGDRIGYWDHPYINKLVEPKYINYDYFKIKCKQGVGLYVHRDSNGHKRKDSYTESDHIKKECLTLNTELIRYSKLKNGKIVEGLKQKVHDKENSSWWGKAYKFDDLLSDDYSSIRYDDNKQIFFLEQKVDGKIKKGFVGVSFDWHFGGAGWRIWGYPNLKIEVNVPCEYDDLQIIDDNYALVKKDGKYGLLEFSFGKSNGDWDYNNRKRSANGKWREIVPCMYDTLEKASHKNNFIGKIGDEEEIITGIVDSETGESVIVANNYKKVTPLYNNVFLCELENGKKETVVINKFSYHHNETNNLHSISRISPCDSAEVINSNSRSRYLIKVTNDGVSDVYHENSTKETMEKFEENVADVSHIQAYDWYVIKKDDGHIKYVSNADRTIFTTADLGIEANNLSVDYLYSLNKFKVTNNDSIRICNYKKGVYDGESKNIFEDRTFAAFDTLQTRNYKFIGYTEITDDGLKTKLSRIVQKRDNGKWQESEFELLSGNFQVENIVLNGKRIIFSTNDPETEQKKFGVIESQEGNVCIDCDFNNIQYDSDNKVFICNNDEGDVLFDCDGYIAEGQDVATKKPDKHVLTLQMKKEN